MSQPLDTQEQFRRYLEGVPLNDTNAALLEQQKMEEPRRIPEMLRPVGTSRPITDDDRRDLQELVSLPGWEVFRRLQEKALETNRAHAISVSAAENPLGRAQEISERWAYDGIYRAAHVQMLAIVQNELLKLQEKR